jgi:hypothetical protein
MIFEFTNLVTNDLAALGNKCAGRHNLETVYFKEMIVSGYFLA